MHPKSQTTFGGAYFYVKKKAKAEILVLKE